MKGQPIVNDENDIIDFDISKLPLFSLQIEDEFSDINSFANSLLMEMITHDLIGNEEQLKKAKDFSVFCPLNRNRNVNSRFFIKNLSVEGPQMEQIIKQYIIDLPLPIKNLIIARAISGENVKSYDYKLLKDKDATEFAENFFKYWILFKNLYEVQYFEGFDMLNTKSPVWKTLTKAKLGASNKILCRIKKYKLPSNTSYFPDIPKLEMPIFDQYFYIDPNS